MRSSGRLRSYPIRSRCDRNQQFFFTLISGKPLWNQDGDLLQEKQSIRIDDFDDFGDGGTVIVLFIHIGSAIYVLKELTEGNRSVESF